MSKVQQIIKCFLILFLIAVGTSQVHASRHALVIGNSDYSGRFNLVNPKNDSIAIANKLRDLGYQVHNNAPLFDLNYENFNKAIDTFLSSVEDGSSTLIYYAGHGAASGGSNYLIPILPRGVILRSATDIRNRSLSLQGILDRVEARNPTGVNVLFFDACRDAPVESNTRNINLSGLTTMDTGRQPRGSFVGFSTEYGQLALDGVASGNSPFASALLETLDTDASAPIELFYKNVTDKVYNVTEGAQFPIQEAKIRGNHCIIECEERLKTGAAQEFGQLTINTIPANSDACFLIEGWTKPNCGHQVVLPLNKPVQITVSAKGHKPYTETRRLTAATDRLAIQLEPKNFNTLKIIGGVAAAIIGGLILSNSSSGGDEDTPSGDPATITLVRP